MYIVKIALGTARITDICGLWPDRASNNEENHCADRRSAHSAARAAHARILLSYEDQLYHQAE